MGLTSLTVLPVLRNFCHDFGNLRIDLGFVVLAKQSSEFYIPRNVLFLKIGSGPHTLPKHKIIIIFAYKLRLLFSNFIFGRLWPAETSHLSYGRHGEKFVQL